MTNYQTKTSKTPDRYEFEILVVEASRETWVNDYSGFLSHIDSNRSLWKNSRVEGKQIKFESGFCKILPLNKNENIQAEIHQGYIVTLNGSFGEIEPSRKPLIEHIKLAKFDKIYILKDNCSKHLAEKLYPLIYEVETSLRGYIMKFMVTKLGIDWWKLSAESSWHEDLKKRKDNESVFGEKLIENQAYLVGFPELGQLIYKQSSGFIRGDKLREEILSLNETAESIREFKKKIESNYDKFFKDSFQSKKFQHNWEELNKLRRKVAHNSLFEQKDFTYCEQLRNEIIDAINDANSKLAALTISGEEIEEILSHISVELKDITEEQFLEFLRERENYFDKTEGFVGLSNFVRNYLGAKGFDIKTSYEVFNSLDEKGMIESYFVSNPYSDNQVQAIRTRHAAPVFSSNE